MAWNKTRTATFFDKEILKYFSGAEITRNVVIDSTEVVADAGGRLILEAGQVLAWTDGDGSKVRPAAAEDLAADIAGILTHTVEFFYPADDDKTDEPAAIYFDNAHFDTAKLVGYAAIAAQVKLALPRCVFY